MRVCVCVTPPYQNIPCRYLYIFASEYVCIMHCIDAAASG